MHWIDILIFITYMTAMLGIGFFFLKKNSSTDDYFVGGRKMSSLHVGLSVVATDVGGGFSIGLGGLGFTIGLSGSWMLFTGLIGAWLAAVLLIPRVSKLSKTANLLTFPQLFGLFYNKKVAYAAGIISAIGYLGFTSSQVLAGAKLASSTFASLDLKTAIVLMGLIAVVYTVMGGIKAVIYTDTVQWILLMGGLIFIGLPLGYTSIGGYQALRDTLPTAYLSFGNIKWHTFINWGITIIPIWFVGMTLYQRIYACRDEKEAKKAWFIAGLFEWPIMAIMGVLLGIFAKVAFEQGMFAASGFPASGSIDEELGLPLLLKHVLPVGLLGLMMSAYFSAVMSTADSCLMASAGNITTDILGNKIGKSKNVLRLSQVVTLGVGLVSLVIALFMENVLELMLYSYAFMVSGLLIPLIAALYFNSKDSLAAYWSIWMGGGTTLILIISGAPLPLRLDANIFGVSMSALTFIVVRAISNKKQNSTKK